MAHTHPLDFSARFWDESVIPTLMEFIKIPNKSVHFDPDWQKNGHVERALNLVTDWLKSHEIPGSRLYVGKIPGRTPIIIIEVPGQTDKTVLLYGHLDKQPEMTGWHKDLGPWTPVIRDDKLYGRGGADDGYAIFCSISIAKYFSDLKLKHPRFVILIEFSEESGSIDLPAYLNEFSSTIGTPDLVICLDSEVGNYEQFWLTSSLRGMVGGSLKVEVMTEGVHSGKASGIIPSSFRIMRQLLSRVEDENTGQIVPDFFSVCIPPKRVEQAHQTAKVLGESIFKEFPVVSGLRPVSEDIAEMILNRTWRSTLCYTGIDGIPSCQDAGNVLRPFTEIILSFRIPPSANAKEIEIKLHELLTSNPPSGAKVTAKLRSASGWESNPLSEDLESMVKKASLTYYGKPAVSMGEGGSIPFMAMLGQKFPKAEFIITGVLGPHSNAHGPNEFLHIPYAKKLTACLIEILKEYSDN